MTDKSDSTDAERFDEALPQRMDELAQVTIPPTLPPLPKKEPPNKQYWVDRAFWDSYVASKDFAVRAERERCLAIVRSYLSPRSGILLSRRPSSALDAIIDKIMSGAQP